MLYYLTFLGEADQIKASCNDHKHLTYDIPIVKVYSGRGHILQAARVTGPVTWSCNIFTDASSERPTTK
jgi:hypothetical protein